MPAPHDALTTRQLAARWQCSAQTLANMRARGAGPAYVKVGRLVRYRLEDVRAWEEARTVGALDAPAPTSGGAAA